eukprot:12872552-Alexandrium_andersonii.AAC.1
MAAPHVTLLAQCVLAYGHAFHGPGSGGGAGLAWPRVRFHRSELVSCLCQLAGAYDQRPRNIRNE